MNWDEERSEVNKLLSAYVDELEARYHNAALHDALLRPAQHALAHGKRWRAILARQVSRAVCRQDRTGRACLAAELLHCASLVVDDIEDGSLLRRGREAAHVTFGVDVAINAGNAMYFLGLELLEGREREAYGQEMLRLHEGQARDIFWHKNKSVPSESEWLEMAAGKTGGLARLAARIGAMRAGADSRVEEALALWAEKLGIAFQIMDDVRNLEGTLGKDAEDDIAEGKMSYPVIVALGRLSAPERSELLGLLGRKGVAKEAIALISKEGTLAQCKKKAREVLSEAGIPKEADASQLIAFAQLL